MDGEDEDSGGRGERRDISPPPSEQVLERRREWLETCSSAGGRACTQMGGDCLLYLEEKLPVEVVRRVQKQAIHR